MTRPAAGANPFQAGIGDYLTVEEGVAVFDRVLDSDEAQVLVSTVPLAARIGGSATHDPPALDRPEPEGPGSAGRPATHAVGAPRPRLATPFRTPATERERQLAALIQRTLGFDRVGADDDFFDLGGDSLAAVQAIARINRELGIDLPPHALIDAPTVAALARRVGERSALPEHFVTLRQGVDGPAVVLVHPLGGQTYIYRDLAMRLPRRYPVLGIDAPWPPDADARVGIEDRAAGYVADLLDAVPGPYVLGGASFGGVVAYEMACQLAAAGRPVPLTVMIDSPGPGFVPDLVEDDAWILCYLLTRRRPTDDEVAELRRLDPAVRTSRVIEGLRRSGTVPEASSVAELTRRLAFWRANHRALIQYRPRPYAGRVLYLAAAESDDVNPTAADQPWHALLADGTFTVRVVSGSHITMNYPPNVDDAAQVVAAALTAL